MAPAVASFELTDPSLQRALIQALLLGFVGGLLGVWVVLDRWSFFTHAIASATFPGFVVAAAAGLSPQLFGGISALAAASGISLTAKGVGGRDSSAGIWVVAALALGSVLAGVLDTGSGVDSLLYGTIFAVTDRELMILAVIAGAVVITSLFLWRHWLGVALVGQQRREDRVAAFALGVLLTLVVVTTAYSVGVLQLVALICIPTATVRLLGGSVHTIALTGTLLAMVEAVSSILIANEINVGAGPVLSTLAVALFLCVVVVQALMRRLARPLKRGELNIA